MNVLGLLCLSLIPIILLLMHFNSVFQFDYICFDYLYAVFLNVLPALSLFSFPPSNLKFISGVFFILQLCFFILFFFLLH